MQVFRQTHDAHGLFLFAFDAASVGLSRQRTDALEQAALAIRQQDSWLASLGDIHRWWSSREEVSLSFALDSPEAYELVVENAGARSIEGVSINFWYNTSEQGALVLESS